MITLKIKKQGYFARTRTLNLPTDWNDIKITERFVFIRALALLPFEMAILEITRRLLKLSRYYFQRINTETIALITEKLAWMQLQPSSQPIILDFTHNKVRYILPKENFLNTSAYEFALADDYYNEFQEDPKNYSNLLKLVATLCRPFSEKNLLENGDARESISFQNAEFKIESRAEKLKDLDFSVSIIVLKYFEGVKLKVHQFGTKSGLFEIPLDEEEPEILKNKQSEPKLFGWWTAFRSILKTQNKTEEQIWQMSLWRVIAIMIEEKKYADEQMKRLNTKS